MGKFRLSYFLIPCLLVTAVSCAELSAGSCAADAEAEGERECVTLNVRASVPSTKTTDVSSENNIETLEVFAFVNGELEAYGYARDDNVYIKVYTGNVDLVCIANYEEIPGITGMTEDQLDEVVCRKDLTAARYVMYGKEQLRSISLFSDGTPSVLNVLPCEVKMYRIVSRLAIDKVTNKTGGMLTINEIYVINVPGDAQLSAALGTSDYEPTIWYNQSWNLGDQDGFLSSDFIGDIVLNSGVYAESHYFYSYPNPTETDNSLETFDGSAWKTRFTRLVVEASLEGETCYYPVTFGGIKSNCSYEITNLTVTGSGAINPDKGPINADTGGDFQVPGIGDLNPAEGVSCVAEGETCIELQLLGATAQLRVAELAAP